MSVNIYEITKKQRQSKIGLASIEDFELGNSNHENIQIILENPNISLYCLDFNQNIAVFVETPPVVNFSQASFFYATQFEKAIRVLTLPFEEMIRLAQAVNFEDKNLILIHSVGRAGSTLASQIFAQIENIVNISEPDALTALVAARHYQLSSDSYLLDLLQASVRLLCKTNTPKAWVIKGRSFTLELGDFFYQVFPRSKNIFLYRDAESWLRSAIAAFSNDAEKTLDERYIWERKVRQSLTPLVPLIAKYDNDKHLSFVNILFLMWQSIIEQYIYLQNTGIDMLAIPYDCWLSDPYSTSIAMLTHCELEAPEKARIQSVLVADSQAGTALSQQTIKQKNVSSQISELETIKFLFSDIAEPLLSKINNKNMGRDNAGLC
ncbi:MAG: hypothetical protein MH252_03780 [Thermosynechococcaceae cyanobacterium MS004]|nr:hypothetical protein [Thermosynechococcaceae cyanobacterium MS004]